jgi:TPR repeat protein
MEPMKEREWFEGDGAGLWDDDWRMVAGLLRRAVEAGFAPAYVELGDLRRGRYLLEEDYFKARALYRRGAEAGDPDAIGRLGEMIYDGEGGPRDRAEGLRLVKMAAEAGSAVARNCLADKLMFGQGVRADEAEAVRLLFLAIEGGSQEAIKSLGFFAAGLPKPARWTPRLTTLVNRAAEADSPNARVVLALFNEFGVGKPIDLVSARRWYELGARVGESISVISLARFYFFGLGGPVDKGAARVWLERIEGEDRVEDALRRLSARRDLYPWSSRITRSR